MTKEKINIFVPEETDEILKKDAQIFEIFKADRSKVNMNRFLSQLLIGYYDMYTAAYQQMQDQISSVLAKGGVNDTPADITDRIIKKIIFPDTPKSKGIHSRRLSLKPTNSTAGILLSIENSLHGDSLSQYLCRMITSYTRMSINERERIIFKDTYELLQNSCKNQLSLSFVTAAKPDVSHEVLPYCIDISKEELHNYLLCQEYDSNSGHYESRSYRLNRIIHAQNIGKRIPPDQEVFRHLEMMKRNGPQYAINGNDEFCVRLTEYGVNLYNKILIGRPTVERKAENNDGTYCYYFKGSEFQMYTYFRRFDGDSAIILSPKRLQEKMIAEYQKALDAYASLETHS